MRIELQLLKELKEAGFYQDMESKHDDVSSSIIYSPNLDELTEKCGGEWHEFILRWRSGFWWATAMIEELPDIDWQKGETPEEAIAKLWLQINSKSSEEL